MSLNPRELQADDPPELARYTSEFVLAMTEFVGEYAAEHPELGLQTLALVPTMTPEIDGFTYRASTALIISQSEEEDEDATSATLLTLVDTLRRLAGYSGVRMETLLGALVERPVTLVEGAPPKARRSPVGRRPGTRPRHGHA